MWESSSWLGRRFQFPLSTRSGDLRSAKGNTPVPITLNEHPSPKTQMLTPFGVSIVFPVHTGRCSMGESVSTESQPSKLCSWILWPNGLQVKRNSEAKFFFVSCSSRATCGFMPFSTGAREPHRRLFPGCGFQSKANKTGKLCTGSTPSQVKANHAFGLAALLAMPQKRPESPHEKS